MSTFCSPRAAATLTMSAWVLDTTSALGLTNRVGAAMFCTYRSIDLYFTSKKKIPPQPHTLWLAIKSDCADPGSPQLRRCNDKRPRLHSLRMDAIDGLRTTSYGVRVRAKKQAGSHTCGKGLQTPVPHIKNARQYY